MEGSSYPAGKWKQMEVLGYVTFTCSGPPQGSGPFVWSWKPGVVARIAPKMFMF